MISNMIETYSHKSDQDFFTTKPMIVLESLMITYTSQSVCDLERLYLNAN